MCKISNVKKSNNLTMDEVHKKGNWHKHVNHKNYLIMSEPHNGEFYMNLIHGAAVGLFNI